MFFTYPTVAVLRRRPREEWAAWIGAGLLATALTTALLWGKVRP